MHILGFDVGSITVGVVMTGLAGDLIWSAYRYHHGMIGACLSSIVEAAPACRPISVVGTTSSQGFLSLDSAYDQRIAAIAAAKRTIPTVRSVLNIGGERFSLTSFNNQGEYENLKGNTSCAAGTGSFLDQQGIRLNLQGGHELAERALANLQEPPIIASRCSVFAKTDIIHAQQEGYTIEEICDGLCFGLAKNVTDTLVEEGSVVEPSLFTGGVSLNKAVAKHLANTLGISFATDPNSHLHEAYGSCLLAIEDGTGLRSDHAADLTARVKDQRTGLRSYYYEPLSHTEGAYPDFTAHISHAITTEVLGPHNPVEVDLYTPPTSELGATAYLGIDIGSTSTKAVLMDDEGHVVSGYYTRTSGRPIEAIRGIFEAVSKDERTAHIKILGVSTTGSGRKFVGMIVGADQIIDEISAHARAAFELDPRVDTVIEIGGQDSKFTVIKGGMVTFSRMNTVCAAGTGSFIEEQAQRLDIPIGDVSHKALGANVPLASDRCTVFMERDINHYLNEGYSVEEVLAATLFAVMENYLLKVANTATIGKRVCFQGATAKNEALIAAFEQRLGLPIAVSKYCHLAGAYGAALTVRDELQGSTAFRGFDLWKMNIPVRAERCGLCLNRCRIRIAEVSGEQVAYGFLCGRDYHTKRYVNSNTSGYDPFSVRRRVEKEAFNVGFREPERDLTIGIPQALALVEDFPMWSSFFTSLGYQVVTSAEPDATRIGKQIERAEFCIPVAALHGHVKRLAGVCDALFLPIYLEAAPSVGKVLGTSRRKMYCYYTQYSSMLASRVVQEAANIPCLMPLLGARAGVRGVVKEIHAAIANALPDCPPVSAILSAYRQSHAQAALYRRRLALEYSKLPNTSEIRVVIVGRQYTTLDDAINKGIPKIFGNLGIQVLFQDMLPIGETADYSKLLDAVHWKQGDGIVNAAAFAATEPGLYPVLLTAFKCAPDAFVTEYFERIMATAGKPYLILQLDDHGSSVGYETRIEAAIRSFRNHFYASDRYSISDALPVNPEIRTKPMGKTVLFPNWDPLTMPLLTASLQRFGLDIRLLEESSITIKEGMRTNTGQCIPVNAIVEESVAYIDKHNLDPSQTCVWMLKSVLSCGIGMYPYYMKSLLERRGTKYRDVDVYLGELTHLDISPAATVRAFFAYLFGGFLRRSVCRLRPYEVRRGSADSAMKEAQRCYLSACEGEITYEEATDRAVALFESVETRYTDKPKVAIFGDVYVRDNDVMNQHLIRQIESFGGEAIVTPYVDYVHIVSDVMFKRWKKQGRYLDIATYKPILKIIKFLEQKYARTFEAILGAPDRAAVPNIEKRLKAFNVRPEHDGESYDNLVKVLHIAEKHADVSLFVQVSPAFCCASLVTEAMSRDIERTIGIPVVTITYDGTDDSKNDIIAPYIRYPRNRADYSRLTG